MFTKVNPKPKITNPDENQVGFMYNTSQILKMSHNPKYAKKNAEESSIFARYKGHPCKVQ